jgi:hypothetical protein
MKRVLMVLVLVVGIAALGTTIKPQSVEELTHASTYVVAAHALRSWTAWDPSHHIIYTYTQFSVSASLKGSAPAAITVRQMGGRLDGLEQKVAGVRQFSPGEDAVLFLHPGIADGSGSLAVTGLMQGYFHQVETAAGPKFTNAVLDVRPHESVNVATRDSGISAYTGATLTYRDLQARVQQALTKESQ